MKNENDKQAHKSSPVRKPVGVGPLRHFKNEENVAQQDERFNEAALLKRKEKVR